MLDMIQSNNILFEIIIIIMCYYYIKSNQLLCVIIMINQLLCVIIMINQLLSIIYHKYRTVTCLNTGFPGGLYIICLLLDVLCQFICYPRPNNYFIETGFV